MSQVPTEEQAVVGEPSATPSGLLRRVHGLVGLISLGGYTALHLLQGWDAFVSRELWVDRVTGFPLANAATIFLLCGVFAHALSAAMLARATDDDPTALLAPEGAPGLRRLQQVTGLVLALFLGVHLVHVWPLTRHDPVLARQGYESIRLWLETPLGLAVYVVATTSLAFHWAHGMSRLAVSMGWVKTLQRLRATRYLCGVLGIVLWCVTLHWVGHFANGVGLWPLSGDEDPSPEGPIPGVPTVED